MTRPDTPTLRAHLGLFAVNLIYGINFSVAKSVMGEGYLTPFVFILVRVLGATALFWAFACTMPREPLRRADVPLLVLCSLFGVVINQLMFFSGLERTTTINASLIMITAPILVLLISSVWLGERITWRKVAGIALGALGVYFLLGGRQFSLADETVVGDLFILINASSYAFYLVLVKPLMRRYHPYTVIRWVFTFAVVPVLVVSFREVPAIDWAGFPGHVWLRIAYVVVFTTFLAYLLNIFALRQVNPTMVGIYIYLQPVLAGLIGALFFDERWTLLRAAAAACIFAGVLLVSIARTHPPKPTT